jgi:hypothetical protein
MEAKILQEGSAFHSNQNTPPPIRGKVQKQTEQGLEQIPK